MLDKLNGKVLSLTGNPIMGFDKQALTVKDALVTLCEVHKPKQSGNGEALRIFSIGLKLVAASESLDLDEKEIQLLRKVVEDNEVFVSVVTARLMNYIEEYAKES